MVLKKLSILIPVFNEEKTVQYVLEKINSVQLLNDIIKEIVIVDDCSRDKTREEIRKFMSDFPEVDIKFLEHKTNMGKGAGIRTGIEAATGDYVIIQDADLEYDPNEINKLLQPIVDGNADVVLGSRFLSGSSKRVLYFWHSMGNRFLTLLSNFMTDLNLSDMEVGYKLIPARILKSLTLEENRFGFEPEVVGKLAGIKGLRIFEVGISYYGRTYEEGKKINWKDGFRAIYCIFKYSPLPKRIGRIRWIRKPEDLLSKINPALVFWLALIAGVVFRVRDYLFQRSLWLDEAFLANNLMNRSFGELLAPLDYSQMAPIGFLYLEKFAYTVFGPSELSLRFFPLLAGIFSLPLFYLGIKKLFNSSVASISVVIISLTHYLIFYSNELKQYSGDLFFASLILYLFAQFHDSEKTKDYLRFGIFGAIIVWFSNPSILVISGFGLPWIFFTPKPFEVKARQSLYWVGLPVLSTVIYYFLFLYGHPSQSIMKEFWAEFFLPVDNIEHTYNWILSRGNSLLKNTLTIRSAVMLLAVLFFLIGVIVQIFQENKYKAFLFLPLFLHLVLSSIKVFPWDTRLILYGIPFIILYISIGIGVIGYLFNSRILVIVLTYLMTFKSIQYDIRKFKEPRKNENLRPVLEQIDSKLKQDEKLYVYSSAQPAFNYYLPIVFSRDISDQIIYAAYLHDSSAFEMQLETLTGKTWIVISHPNPVSGIEMIDNMIEKREMDVLDSIYDQDARALLVEFPSNNLQ